jgi:hypothetical protein
MDSSEGRSLSNMGKPVENGDVVLVCEWQQPSTEKEMLLKEMLSPSGLIGAVVGGFRATYDTRFVASRVRRGKADITFQKGEGHETFSNISTVMLAHPPVCKVGDRAVVRDEYFRCLADAEEAKRHFVLLTEHGEVTETGVEKTSIRFGEEVFIVPTRYVVTIEDLSSADTQEVIAGLLGDLSDIGKPQKP